MKKSLLAALLCLIFAAPAAASSITIKQARAQIKHGHVLWCERGKTTTCFVRRAQTSEVEAAYENGETVRTSERLWIDYEVIFTSTGRREIMIDAKPHHQIRGTREIPTSHKAIEGGSINGARQG